MKNEIYETLEILIPEPKCELNYERDYELLIATILSAQCTDIRVNKVTKLLFAKYDIFSLANASLKDIEVIIRSVGSYTKKAIYITQTAKLLVRYYSGKVPNNREFLENLPGVGRKTANVVLKNLYNEPCIPVDTHVQRVAKRLELVPDNASVEEIEKTLMEIIPKEKWNKVAEQILLFGRYYCKAIKPLCSNCLLKDICKKKPVNHD